MPKTALPSTPPAQTMESPSGVAVLDRAFSLLNAFGPADTSLTLAELAARTGLYKSTILRIAESLAGHRFLVRHADGRFQIGPAPLALGAIYQRSVRLADVVLPVMRELSQLADDGASFYIRVDDRRMCLHRVDSRHAVKDHVREGDILPLDRGSGGRVLTAFSDNANNKGTIAARIRETGYFISTGDRDAETFGISAPVFGSGARLVGVLTLAGPGFRMTEAKLMKLRAPLLMAAAQATLALGGDASILQRAASLARKRGPAAKPDTPQKTSRAKKDIP